MKSAAATPRATADSIPEEVCEAAVVLTLAHQARAVAETLIISDHAADGEATWFNAAVGLLKLLELEVHRWLFGLLQKVRFLVRLRTLHNLLS